MERFNAFNQIHKALRVLMYDTATLISQTDFENPEQQALVIERLSLVLDSFDKHAHHEDTMVLPQIQQYEPAVVDAFEKEHETDHALAQGLRGFQTALAYAVSADAKQKIGVAISFAFADFMIFNLQHMKKEETVLNNILWRYFSDEELIGINQKIVASIPPPESAITAKWMLKGMSNSEITNWLKNVERNAPTHVFRPLFTMAEKELEQSRFGEIAGALTKEAMLASSSN